MAHVVYEQLTGVSPNPQPLATGDYASHHSGWVCGMGHVYVIALSAARAHKILDLAQAQCPEKVQEDLKNEFFLSKSGSGWFDKQLGLAQG